ncbi:TetR/AcrR family transcriptional regulator [Wukongibacter sp. M2B1]|uniref:TetR/AcrR family transcriptional regulator n=1 Tax=Wukongibacter sp. M2B1 TaxID=3088895 RepID=UPI003D7B461F
MDKKEIQKKRMMGYFIEAANQIIENEGIENVSIRKVADIAGYNSATLYNYFENLDHLVFFACMKYLRGYVSSLPQYLHSIDDPIDKYLCIWKAFCYHSFEKPKIYHTIFFNKFSTSLDEAIKKYYDIFPEDLGSQSNDLLPMLLGDNIYERNMAILKSCIDNKNIKNEYIEEMNEMNILIYQAMLSRVLNNQIEYTIDEAVTRTLQYMKQSIISYINIDNLES